MIRLAFALSYLLFAGVAAAQNAGCKRNDFGVFEDINCATEAAQTADRELNATFTKLLEILRPAEAAALRKAQDSWMEYVKVDARFVLEREGNGSAGHLVVVNNRERLTRERTLALKSWLPR